MDWLSWMCWLKWTLELTREKRRWNASRCFVFNSMDYVIFHQEGFHIPNRRRIHKLYCITCKLITKYVHYIRRLARLTWIKHQSLLWAKRKKVTCRVDLGGGGGSARRSREGCVGGVDIPHPVEIDLLPHLPLVFNYHLPSLPSPSSLEKYIFTTREMPWVHP